MARALRWLVRATALGALAAALALAAAFAAAEHRIARSWNVAAEAVPVPRDGPALERGRHLVEDVAQCSTCHGADLSGRPLADDFWLGRLWAANLTPGRGGIGSMSDRDLVRSIRWGVRRDGRSLLLMPSQHLRHLGDADLGAVIAWLRQLPPVDRQVPAPRLGPLAALALASGRAPDLLAAPLAATAPAVSAPPPGPTAAYGAYLVEAGGCRVCHRPDLAGGRHPLSLPGEPPPPDLTRRGPLAAWAEADFVRALRSGVTPDGRHLDPAWMPWPALARMSDLELRAIWRYLRRPPGSAPRPR